VQARKSKKFSVLPEERRCSLWGNVEAPAKSPQCFWGREDVTPGAMWRHEIKTFSPMSEFRRAEDLLADERVQAS